MRLGHVFTLANRSVKKPLLTAVVILGLGFASFEQATARQMGELGTLFYDKDLNYDLSLSTGDVTYTILGGTNLSDWYSFSVDSSAPQAFFTLGLEAGYPILGVSFTIYDSNNEIVGGRVANQPYTYYWADFIDLEPGEYQLEIWSNRNTSMVGVESRYSFTIAGLPKLNFDFEPETPATGYIYQVDSTGPLIQSAHFTTVLTNPDGYKIYALGADGERGDFLGNVAVGGAFTFASAVSGFWLEGIDPANMLDPRNPQAFVANFTYDRAGTVSFTRTSITAIPEPETWVMLLTGLGIVAAVTRRRRTKAAM